MKRFLLALSLLLGCGAAFAGPFTDGTVLTAAALNNALAAPTITGGSINGAPIGATTPSTGAFTTLSATGATTLGAATATTPATGDNSTKVCTTAYVQSNLASYAPLSGATFTGAISAPTISPTSAAVPTDGIFLPSANTIGFAVNGAEVARIDANGNLLVGTTVSPSGSGNIVASGIVKTGGYTVATLPTGMPTGSRAYVTDATAPSFLQPVSGGGAVVCPVFYNGTAWVAE